MIFIKRIWRTGMKACPNENRSVKVRDLKRLERKIKREDRKEDAKIYQRKRKK